MIEAEIQKDRVEQLGEDWIEAIMNHKWDRLEPLCHPQIVSRLLTPKRFVNAEDIHQLVAKYRQWFGECTHIQLEASRIGNVGDRLAIFYRFHLQEQEDWYTVEQQLYCTLKDGRVEHLDLLCSGFQLVVQPAAQGSGDDRKIPSRDGLLEMFTGVADPSSTCAVLTPAIRSRLREMQSGQVLEVRVDDPTARGDIEAWCRLSGNELLKTIEEEGQILRFFLKKK